MKRACLIILIVLCIMGSGCEKKSASKPGNQEKRCTLFVECSKAVENNSLKKELKEYLPKDGVIFAKKEVAFTEGDSVYDVLERAMKEEGILMEASFTGDIAYIEGIDNLYEFECGDLSGWMYCVNGAYQNVGCSSYTIQEGDVIEWHYSCSLGSDLGQTYEKN